MRSAFTLASPPTPDVELLSRFIACNDQNTFAELVRRYGPMVLGVCRRTRKTAPPQTVLAHSPRSHRRTATDRTDAGRSLHFVRGAAYHDSLELWLAGLPLVAVAVGLSAAGPSKPTAPPPKTEEKAKRNATVKRVKLIGVDRRLSQPAIQKDLELAKQRSC